ncbi:MAG TPA: methyltransferase [Micromonosporaceae bacterium]
MTADHYFAAEPTAPEREREVEVAVGGRTYHLVTGSGVFSATRLDPGTAVLLRKAPLPGPRGGTYLDLGCGYGPIACALANTSGDATVYAVDVNTRALDLVRRNAAANRVAGRIVATGPDDVDESVRFDEIWSNPPIRVGKSELHALLGRWLPRLAPDGTGWLVVARNLGGDSLQKWLTEQGWQVERFASQKGYRVLRVSRSDEDE